MNKIDTLIPVAAPSITARESELAAQAAAEAWGPNHYAFNREFEEKFAAYIGVPYAISLPHATSGLHLGLAAAGIGAGDEVIAPAVTWIASVAPIDYVGATPVFVDIDLKTWTLDIDAVEAAITPKTKAIIGVDLYGSMCNWGRLRELAETHGLFLIEDAAEALGSELDGQKAGAFGDVGIFSFHGSKTLTTGEGGMIVMKDKAIYDQVQHLRDHGRAPGDRFFQNTSVAFKYKMSAMQAAVGLAQLERIEELVAKKRSNFALYQQYLSQHPNILLNAEPQNVLNSFWMVTAIVKSKPNLDKFALMAKLREWNIDSRPFFSVLCDIKAYEPRTDSFASLKTLDDTRQCVDYAINLPSGYDLDEEKIKYICECLIKVVDEN
ncbi:MAG: DegT/DnrJ/EryC1/StrS family aminotransferase [Cohaesibacter sp.]|nr:DegT/DnrJ/EryC1/StrS family aminotransferase [Cohaesibacter sp.]